MRLHRLSGGNPATLFDAVVDEKRFTLIQHVGAHTNPITIGINNHHGVILRRHDRHTDIFEKVCR